MTLLVGKIEEINISNNNRYCYIINVNIGNNIYHNIITRNKMKIPLIGTLIVIFIGTLGPSILATVNPKTNQHNLLIVFGNCNIGDTIVPQIINQHGKQNCMMLALPNAKIYHNSNVLSKLSLM
jgi:hypothetical protein